MSDRLTNPEYYKSFGFKYGASFIAILLLLFVFFITIFSIKDDSLTMDELAHLPAGYSYLTQQDMRLNPEHPPLIKDLAAFPLLFIKDINFPSQIKAWQEDVNGQWDFGTNFLFRSGNPADKMIFWGRIPMILILLLLGFYIFKWARELFGNKGGLLALFLFSFSPTLLAHSRLVTTDVGAATAIFIATYYFVKFLKNSSKRNLVLAGIAFGLAELAKFSVILLLPFFVILFFAFLWIKSENSKVFWKNFSFYFVRCFLIFLIGFLIIWLFYIYHTWNYPPERQLRDAKNILASFAGGPSSISVSCFNLSKIPRCPGEIVIWMSDKPLLRAIGYYFFGLLMVFQRAVGGNTTYFLGEVANVGWKFYFPLVYVIKETLVFHILTIISLLYLAWQMKKPFWQNILKRFRDWLSAHFSEFAMLLFIVIYWTTSLKSNLNIGVRHLLPVFPLTITLISGQIANLLQGKLLRAKYAVLFLLLALQAVSVISVFPHLLAYFNKLAGGPDRAYLLVVDSNLDWGQDLKRLSKWVDGNKIDKIYVDYFGGADTKYYLKEKYSPWWGNRNPKELPPESYLAISATFLQGGRGNLAKGFKQPADYYRWLDKYTPVAKIGYSIFVYYID